MMKRRRQRTLDEYHRSQAAKRGWETRRRRAEFARRSKAAKKGWETRRAYEREIIKHVQRQRQIPVYAEDLLSPGAQLGFAYWPDGDPESVARDARPDEEIETWWVDQSLPQLGAVIYVVRFALEEEEKEPPEDVSDEWEIGFSYRGGDSNSHVDVNFRIAREDGAAFGHTEAMSVYAQFRENLGREDTPIPSGYVMAWIDWRRPRWRSDRFQSSTDDVDLDAFRHPMYYESDNDGAWSEPSPTRLGSVKS